MTATGVGCRLFFGLVWCLLQMSAGLWAGGVWSPIHLAKSSGASAAETETSRNALLGTVLPTGAVLVVLFVALLQLEEFAKFAKFPTCLELHKVHGFLDLFLFSFVVPATILAIVIHKAVA